MATYLVSQMLEQGKHSKAQILVICAKNDPIIRIDELREDSQTALGGRDKLHFRTIDAGHDFPITKSDEVIDMVLRFWDGHA